MAVEMEFLKNYILGEYLEIVKREGRDVFNGVYDFEELLGYVIEYWKGEAKYWETEFHELNAVVEDPSLLVVR